MRALALARVQRFCVREPELEERPTLPDQKCRADKGVSEVYRPPFRCAKALDPFRAT